MALKTQCSFDWGFHAPNFDWERDLSLSNCNYYSKLKGNAIFTSTYHLVLIQCLATDSSVDLLFGNFNRVSTFFGDASVVKHYSCHPLIVTEITLNLQKFCVIS